MANPQKENGFVAIANEIVEALGATRIPGEAVQVLWIILRKTYGFNKKEDWISLSQFQEATGISKPHIVRALKMLLDMNIIAKKGNNVAKKGNEPITYCLNKNYELWEKIPKRITLPKKAMIVAKKGNASLPKKEHTKDNTTKDNLTKDNSVLSKDNTGEHKEAIRYWHEIYKKYVGIPYNFNGGKDGSIIKRLLKVYGLEKLKEIMMALITSDDEFYRKRSGRTLGVLSACSNKLAESLVEIKGKDYGEAGELK